MRYLFDDWNSLGRNLKQNSIFLFLDYDGTLAPIVDKPEQAILPKDVKKLLEALSENSKFRVAVISGRALDDVKARVGVDNFSYVGNHGLEIYDSKLYFRWMMPEQYKKFLAEIKK